MTVLAVASLFLPFALRASRMMWVVTLSGGALAVASSRIVVAVDDDGPVAGSVLPGVVFALLGLLACVGLVSGMAVHRFSLLRQGNGSRPVLTRLEAARPKTPRCMRCSPVSGAACWWPCWWPVPCHALRRQPWNRVERSARVPFR